MDTVGMDGGTDVLTAGIESVVVASTALVSRRSAVLAAFLARRKDFSWRIAWLSACLEPFP
jgi:hypothetical protein